MWTVAFWKGAGERALWTFIETFVAALVAAITGKTTAWDVPWGTTLWAALGMAVIATVLSVAKSLSSPSFTAGVDPSLYSAADIPEPADPDVASEEKVS